MSYEEVMTETWMPEARQIAAQCWCDPETSDRLMDSALAEAVARRIAVWMGTGAFYARNAAYWRERAHHAEHPRWFWNAVLLAVWLSGLAALVLWAVGE